MACEGEVPDDPSSECSVAVFWRLISISQLRGSALSRRFALVHCRRAVRALRRLVLRGVLTHVLQILSSSRHGHP